MQWTVEEEDLALLWMPGHLNIIRESFLAVFCTITLFLLSQLPAPSTDILLSLAPVLRM
jgi:hypothetical protein